MNECDYNCMLNFLAAFFPLQRGRLITPTRPIVPSRLIGLIYLDSSQSPTLRSLTPYCSVFPPSSLDLILSSSRFHHLNMSFFFRAPLLGLIDLDHAWRCSSTLANLCETAWLKIKAGLSAVKIGPKFPIPTNLQGLSNKLRGV